MISQKSLPSVTFFHRDYGMSDCPGVLQPVEQIALMGLLGLEKNVYQCNICERKINITYKDTPTSPW